MTVFPQLRNNQRLFPSQEQVYLRSARNATVLPHLLAHLPNILAKEKEIWQKREMTNEKRATHNVTPDYVAEAIC
jgi:hypothetical protein